MVVVEVWATRSHLVVPVRVVVVLSLWWLVLVVELAGMVVASVMAVALVMVAAMALGAEVEVGVWAELLVESVVMVVAVLLSLLMVCLGGGKTERESKRTRERESGERDG